MPDTPKNDDGIVFVEGGEQDPFQQDGDAGIGGTAGGIELSTPNIEDEVEIDNAPSKVASAPAKNILVLAVMAIASLIFIYKVVFTQSEEEIQKEKKQEEVAAQPVESATLPTRQVEQPQVNIGVVETPELPTIENVEQPPLPLPVPPPEPEPVQEVEAPPIEVEAPVVAAESEPAPPPPVVAVEEPVVVENPDEEIVEEIVEEQAPEGPGLAERILQRRGSNMMVMNGGGVPADANADGDELDKSSVTPVKATKVEDLSRMVLQGKMVDAILETTINTDLPGSLRAIISRDVYAEAGKTVLIPKGSRLIGTYNSGVTQGQQRILVTWGRVIRPDGVDIDIASPGTDQLGRSGMTGIVDNKYFELFSNSLLISAVTIGGTIALSKVQDAQTVSTTTSTAGAAEGGGSASTNTGTPADAAVLQGVQSLGDTAKEIAKGASTQPTIIVNQGARVKVFVNKDLIFPESAVKKVLSNN